VIQHNPRVLVTERRARVEIIGTLSGFRSVQFVTPVEDSRADHAMHDPRGYTMIGAHSRHRSAITNAD